MNKYKIDEENIEKYGLDNVVLAKHLLGKFRANGCCSSSEIESKWFNKIKISKSRQLVNSIVYKVSTPFRFILKKLKMVSISRFLSKLKEIRKKMSRKKRIRKSKAENVIKDFREIPVQQNWTVSGTTL